MQKAAILGPQQGGLVEAPDPKAVADWALVKIHVAPMCTEYKGFVGGQANASLGHEAAGEVLEVAQASRVRPGDRVVVMPQFPCGVCALCIGGEYIHCQQIVDFAQVTGSAEGRATMAQLLLKPDWLLPPIPDHISYEHASMACCGLGPTFGAMQRMDVNAFDTLLITGLGPVGLGGVINGVHRGSRVMAADLNPWRRQKALELGATEAIDPSNDKALQQLLDLTDGIGVDKAIDCSGAVPAHRLCIDAVRRRGQVAFVGECGDETPVRISPDLIRKGIALIGSWHYNRRDFPQLMQVIEKNPERLDTLIGHIFPMSEVQKAWELQVTGECAKILLKPWE
ncbi:MAG: zinc-binding dehydrogenase [Candidatus Latescibacteria bacterium]|nr:zinc-binding dehydrogenase [Candidatus Latescibacterota bacterium]